MKKTITDNLNQFYYFRDKKESNLKKFIYSNIYLAKRNSIYFIGAIFRDKICLGLKPHIIS
jgi:hypothetical protein